tara:strand:+ start:85 stop:504 length:420 start_codon:yes stop_codon:yes gene_type:complete
MKKAELKKLIKPIVEDCVRDILLKEGVLSTIISEVMIGVSGQQPIVENNNQVRNSTIDTQAKNKLAGLHEAKKKLMDEIGRDSFKGVNLFEGTTPAPGPSSQGNKYGAMKDLDSSDPGVNIDGLSEVMGDTWKTLMKGK